MRTLFVAQLSCVYVLRAAEAEGPIARVAVVADGEGVVVGCGASTPLVDRAATHPLGPLPCVLQVVGPDGVVGRGLRLDAAPEGPVTLQVAPPPDRGTCADRCLRVEPDAAVVVAKATVEVLFPSPWARPGDRVTHVDGVPVGRIGDPNAWILDLWTREALGRHAVEGTRDGRPWRDPWAVTVGVAGPSRFDVPGATFDDRR
jgi:hypothetical protein